MKKLLTLIAFVCFWANANAQYVNIPDSNFRKFLIGRYPSCFDTLGRIDTTCGLILNEYSVVCTNKNIKSIDGIQYFKKIVRLICDSNSITKINKLPNNLEFFMCSYNQIDSLPVFKSIYFLDCSHNKLSQIQIDSVSSNPVLIGVPNGLDISHNFFTKISNIANGFNNLNCSNNLLTSLSLKNSKVSSLKADNNFINHFEFSSYSTQVSLLNNNLYCLPKIPLSLQWLTIDSGKILCIPNRDNYSVYITYNDSGNFQILPICNPTNNASNCSAYPIVKLFSFTDYNSNGKLDANEYGTKAIKISSGTDYGYTDIRGTAYINADSLGTYTITAQAPALYKAVPASYTHTFNSYDTLVYDTFALQPLITKDSLSIGITPTTWAARPGFKYVFNVGYENVGTTVVNTNLSFVIDTSKLVFDSASAGSFSGNNLSHSVSNFVPGQNGSFLVYCRVKPTTALGSSFQAVATINGGSAIANDSVVTTIRGSFDPNDKQATPALSVAQVASNSKWIDYTIRFENTGNDTAFTVVVADTLDASKLQTSSVQLTGMSHPVKATQNDNIIFFEFRNINLPDSNIDKVKCNGFVSFKVKPLTSLVNGMTVPNKASIYFDYNEPVITNTAQTVIGTLPLTLVNFSAIFKEDENKIFVYWNTANEINTSFFIIEQSIDGRSFAPAAEVAATGKGNNSYYYQLNAKSQQPTVYLRLKMVDRNGAYTYSNIVKLVNNKKQLVIEVAPNPAKNILTVKASAALNNPTATIVNALGKTIKTFTLKQGYQTIDIAALPNGVYYLQSANGVYKFVKE